MLPTAPAAGESTITAAVGVGDGVGTGVAVGAGVGVGVGASGVGVAVGAGDGVGVAVGPLDGVAEAVGFAVGWLGTKVVEGLLVPAHAAGAINAATAQIDEAKRRGFRTGPNMGSLL